MNNNPGFDNISQLNQSFEGAGGGERNLVQTERQMGNGRMGGLERPSQAFNTGFKFRAPPAEVGSVQLNSS